MALSATAALVFAVSAHSAQHAADPASCGFGLPPGAPGFAQQQAQVAADIREKGYTQVCEARLERYSLAFEPIATATKGLAFQPVELGGTPFAGFAPLGGRSDTINGTASQLYRGFRTADGHTLTLFEHDMSADGTSLWRDPADEPERINGLPARLIVLQADTGKAVSSLSWLHGRRVLRPDDRRERGDDRIARPAVCAGPLAARSCTSVSGRGAARAGEVGKGRVSRIRANPG